MKQAKFRHRTILPDPVSDRTFVDNTVYVYRIVDDKEVLVRTESPFPDASFEYQNRIKKDGAKLVPKKPVK